MARDTLVRDFSKQSRTTLALRIAILSCSFFVSGCAVRTSQGEHYIGPVLYTTGQQATVQSMSEQRHFPVLVEVGTQWGLSIGVIRRVRAVPLILDEMGQRHSANQPEHIRSWGMIRLSPTTFLSLLYLRATPSEPPKFLARSILGISLGVGSEQYTLTAGMKHVTEVRPITEGIHRLCYQSGAPERMSYVVAERLESLSQLPCGRILL
ncbi:MAG: hypothetical protein OEY77_01195 [Nitrospira sp.]|nr:hypothetical protein [Nitrospira sp.]